MIIGTTKMCKIVDKRNYIYYENTSIIVDIIISVRH